MDKEIPQKILDLFSSENTIDRIAAICSENCVGDEKDIGKISRQIGLVLLGRLSPENFTGALKKELKLDEDVAEKISSETNRLVFSPVKDDLAKLYEKEAPSEKTEKPMPPSEKKPERPRGKDIYRELTN